MYTAIYIIKQIFKKAYTKLIYAMGSELSNYKQEWQKEWQEEEKEEWQEKAPLTLLEVIKHPEFKREMSKVLNIPAHINELPYYYILVAGLIRKCLEIKHAFFPNTRGLEKEIENNLTALEKRKGKDARMPVVMIGGFLEQKQHVYFLMKAYFEASSWKNHLYLITKNSFGSINGQNMELLEERIEMIRERTGHGKVILIGHSMGGEIAKRYSELHTEQVPLCITTAAPDKGTFAADIAYWVGKAITCHFPERLLKKLRQHKFTLDSLKEMGYKSAFSQREGKFPAEVTYVNLFAPDDTIILEGTGGSIGFGKNIYDINIQHSFGIKHGGHLTAVYHPKTIGFLMDIIEEYHQHGELALDVVGNLTRKWRSIRHPYLAYLKEIIKIPK